MKINLTSSDHFVDRHIGPSEEQIKTMLKKIGVADLDQLIDQTIPEGIRKKNGLNLPPALPEYNYLQELKKIAGRNKVCKSYIGLGYYNTITPAVIRRNIFENPGWYTQYTPYQAEIAQGRLEALLNFQTVVSDLTGLPIANASLLDEATAAAEAMLMFFHQKNKREKTAPKFFVSAHCFPQTIDVLKLRAEPSGIELVVGNHHEVTLDETYFGALVQYPAVDGEVFDYREFVSKAKSFNVHVAVAADILSLAILTPPGEWGADCVVGCTQRFGVPLGFGGPHAAYFATREDYKRNLPGRIIGVSQDRHGNPALRMALQTREQHIRREKATSNICTAQALLAIMAGLYAAYHGPEGIKSIALRVHTLARVLAIELTELGFERKNQFFFDSVTIDVSNQPEVLASIRKAAEDHEMNLRYSDDALIGISLDETTQIADVKKIIQLFAEVTGKAYDGKDFEKIAAKIDWNLPEFFKRQTEYLTHPVFHQYRSETNMMRYIKSLENKDLSLTKSMIPLGSCTMKLNAVSELEPVSWPEFSQIHPFAPVTQTAGYMQIITELENYLNEITGFAATSLQPNSGAQGEFSGLMVIRAYHESRGESHRDIILIPSSAHGTNPASAVMAGGKVVVVACDQHGNIDMDDLIAKAVEYKDRLFGLMITYPSTHGVFEHLIREVIQVVHDNGGQVYMDGANMNAQVGLTSPAIIGADVCHLNLHKTFSIPHGGGGPGMGPICVAEHLAPFLPGNPIIPTGGAHAIPSVSATPYGSASILLISYGYIRMLGAKGVTACSQIAILNANYIKSRLEKHYPILYSGKDHGRVAHELILDLRPIKHEIGIEVEDVAKRLIDFGFHAPTVSFPVAGTMMIEPTESEDLAELDRFCDAMIEIRKEIKAVQNGEVEKDNNVLKNAPHLLSDIVSENWNHSYSRARAVFPLPWVQENKFWPPVARVNNSYGDRNLICTCPPLEDYVDELVH